MASSNNSSNSNNETSASSSLRQPKVEIEPVTERDWGDLLIPQEGKPAVEPSVLQSRQVAKEVTPSLCKVLWSALDGPEPETGNNHLQDLL